MTTPPESRRSEVKSLVKRSDMLTEMERFPDAIHAALEALARSPESARALCALSWAEWNAGRADEALAHAERAVAADPNDEWIHRLRAIYHQDRNEHDLSVAAAREAVRLAPEASSDLFVLSDALMHAGELDEAMQVALRMREVAPESVWSHEMCGGVALKQKQYAGAEAHFRRGLSLAPDRYVSLSFLGLSLLHQGRPREAMDCFMGAQIQRPHDKRAPMVAHNLRIAVRAYLGDNTDGLRPVDLGNNKRDPLPIVTIPPEERQRRWDALPPSIRQWYAAQTP